MRCRVCDADTGGVVVLNERTYGTREAFDYWHCGSCGTLQIGCVPGDMSPYYPRDFYSLHDDITWTRRAALTISGLAFRTFGAHVLTHRLDLEAMLGVLPRPPATILDVGSGEGRMIRQLRHFGYQCKGIDPFLERQGVRDGVTLQSLHIWQVEGVYDVVMLHHSLEHISDPHRAFEAIARLVSPQGIAIVRVPVLPNDVWDEFGTDWPQLDAPRHLYTFSLSALEILASRHGLDVVDVAFDATPWSLIAARHYREGGCLADLGPVDFVPTPKDAARTEQANVEANGDQVRMVLRPSVDAVIASAASGRDQSIGTHLTSKRDA
jgi:SAM-dependent methyltransferase